MCGREEKPGPTYKPQDRESEQLSEQSPETSPAEAHGVARSQQERREHARQLFREYRYLDEAIDTLRAAESPDERAAAARTLGIAGSQRETAPLIAALFDDSPEVRRVASEALAQIGDPIVSFERMSTLVNSGLDRGTAEVIQAAPAEPADAPDVASAKSTTAETLTTVQTPLVDSLTSAASPDEHAIANSLKDLERRIAETAATRKEVENIARLYAESEARFRAQVAARLREEEELRKKAEEEAARRRAEEAEKLQAEHAARVRAESEAASLGEEEALLRIETFKLLQRADELAQPRAETEEARRAARVGDVERLHREAEERHVAELERLRSEEEALTRATQQAAQRRAEVEAARQSSEGERQRLEAEMSQRAQAEQRLLEAVRRRLNDQQQVLEDTARQRAEEEQQRLAQLEASRRAMEATAQERAEKEQRLNGELESLRIAEAEARKRIEEAEARRRSAESTLDLTAEKLQRLEAEAHARAAEEERILARLEDVRRNVAVEVQAREEQEKRVRGEIELLRRLEEEQRQLLAEQSRRRGESEVRLQQAKDRYRIEEEARVRAEAALELLEGERQAKDDEALAWHDDPAENLRPLRPSSAAGSGVVQEEEARNAPGMIENRVSIPGLRMASSDVSPFIVENLNSSDPLNRSAALAALARSGAKDAFRLIVNCFDDQSQPVRNAAVRALSELEPHRPVEPFTRAIEEGSPERRRSIGNAIATSGLAAEAIEALCGKSREYTYNALGLLFAMAKTGELRPLVHAVEAHEDVEVRRAAVKLLTLAGQSPLAEEAARRRLRGTGEGEG